MNDAERAESLRHCRWVDEVIEDAPWVLDQSFLDRHKVLNTEREASSFVRLTLSLMTIFHM